MASREIRLHVDLSGRSIDTKAEILEMLIHIRNENVSVQTFCKNHNIEYYERKLYKWNKKLIIKQSLGYDIFHKQGRRAKVDDIGIENLRAQITDAKSKKKSLTKKEVTALIILEVDATSERAGEAPNGKISKTSLKRVRALIESTNVKGQHKTAARIDAEEDPRNCFSMIAMCYAFAKGLISAMIFNWDATQFKVCGDTSYNVEIVSCKNDGLTMPSTRQSPGETDIFVKLYHYHNAAGNVASPVYCVACESMAADDFLVKPIIGLGSDAAIGSTGYLVFTKTRCCNEAFYRWYVREIVVPFLVDARKYNKQFHQDGSPKRGLIYCDGEAMQIKVFQEPDIIKLLNDNCIDLCKTPASCSAICQSSDAGPFFCTCKRQLATITETTYVGNMELAQAVRECLADDKLRDLSTAHKRKMIEGLQQINYIVKENMKPHLIMSGYRRTGQWINNLKENYATIGLDAYANFNEAMKLCTMVGGKRMALDVLKTFRDALIPAVQIFKERGRITEVEMTELGLINVTKGKLDKDERALHKQRACVMTSATITRQYQAHQKRKLDAEAVKTVSKEERATKKAATTQANIAKLEYRLAFTKMTPEEQKIERLRLKEEKKNTAV